LGIRPREGDLVNAGDFKRKLTAVFSADVVGYSRLMGEDEAGTVKTLEDYKQVMSSLIKQHRGRVVDSPGDNLLAEFASVVDAVQCGVAVQKELQARNADLPENRRMQFRIGINLEDVIEEGNRIYGDGVNIAARLESLADPGGICVSKTAFDHIETKLPLGYEYLGEKEVKNIAKPVGAYKVLMEPRVTVAGAKDKKPPTSVFRRKGFLAGAVAVLVVVVGVGLWNFYLRRPKIEPASKEKMAYPLPDKPSIAVLPFVNISEDPKQEFFCDGITEEIITALSRVPNLFVISRESTFTYKGKPVKVRQVSEELGVRYVLEGSVQRSSDRLRITAQLIDALNGHHIWADRYDRNVTDLFAMQDEITMKIITAMQVKLTSGEMIRVLAKGAKNIDAFTKYLQAVDLWTRVTKEANAQAKKLLEEAIALDPEYPGPYIGLAKTYGLEASLFTPSSHDQLQAKAFEFAQKAISLDNNNGAAYSVLSWLYSRKKEYEKAIAASERAISLNPNSAESYMRLAVVLAYAGRAEEGIPYMQKALRLNPFPSPNYFINLAVVYCESGHYEKAIEADKRALQSEPNSYFPYLNLAISYIRLGREEEARAAAAEVRRISPKFSLDRMAKVTAFKQPSAERMIDDLRKAGLK
jgi:adenylate cyclase